MLEVTEDVLGGLLLTSGFGDKVDGSAEGGGGVLIACRSRSRCVVRPPWRHDNNAHRLSTSSAGTSKNSSVQLPPCRRVTSRR